MKRLKRIGSLLLAAMMVLMVSVPSVFADDTCTITINAKTAGHTYEAYQVFSGDLATDKTLSNIQWGAGIDASKEVDGNNLLAAIKAISVGSPATTLFADVTDAASVAKVLSDNNTNAALAEAFAKVVEKYLAAAPQGTSGVTGETGTVTITGLNPGYYLVKDKAPAEGTLDGYTSPVLQVVGNVTVDPKYDVPEIEKKIVEGENLVDANEAGIGDTVAYQIKGNVPDTSAYDYYYYVINDDLSKGLTLEPDSFYVSIGGTKLTRDTDYKVYFGDEAEGHTFQVAFKDMKNYTKDAEIIVRYTAVVNEEAVIGPEGNPNTVTLTYSNNPSKSGKGDNDYKPGEDNPTGETPEDITKTYVAEIDILKYMDEIDEKNLLKGVEFALTGTSTKTQVVTGTEFKEAADGKYYKLTDGSYTTTKPHGDIKDENDKVILVSNEDAYESTTQKYTPVETSVFKETSEDVVMTGTTDEKGSIQFKGLGAGKYTLTEIKTPDGYNSIDPITIEITIKVPETIKDGTETAEIKFIDAEGNEIKYLDEDGNQIENTTGIHIEKVINESGSKLPSTGGIGTTLFYIAGSILVLFAGALLVTRRRVNHTAK